MQITGRYLNHLQTAVAYKKALLNGIISGKPEFAVPNQDENFYGEDVKVVGKIAQKQKYLTPPEKDEVVEKYADGLTIKEIAKIYGCHRSTVRRILVKRGVAIR
jgi:DNA-directed RNA polymerase specialized sigma24 family protein